MGERMIGDGKTDFKIYPPGVTPDSYVPPWKRAGAPRKREVQQDEEK